MKKNIVLFTMLCLHLVGCSQEEIKMPPTTPESSTPDNSTTVKPVVPTVEGAVVNVCSWGEYIDTALLGKFTEETGITVNYQTAESNEAMYHLLESGLVNFDVVIPSDYMISQLIEEGKLAPLNYDNIPNYSYIGERFQNQPYDPKNEYTVPYSWGTLGMIYNKSLLPSGVTGWDAMFDPNHQGQVLMIRNSRDAFGIALLSLGYSINTTNETQLKQASQLVKQGLEDGVYQGFVMDEVYDKMINNEAALTSYYAGDYLTMAEDNEDLVYVVPEDGFNWFIDAMCVLEDAENKEEAEIWINFMASTEAALANMDYIWYASPNEEALLQYPAYYEGKHGEPLDMEDFAIMAPSEDIFQIGEGHLVLPEKTRQLYATMWADLDF